MNGGHEVCSSANHVVWLLGFPWFGRNIVSFLRYLVGDAKFYFGQFLASSSQFVLIEDPCFFSFLDLIRQKYSVLPDGFNLLIRRIRSP